MSYDSTSDFLAGLDAVPELPRTERGEWCHDVRSQWIDGVFYRDKQDPFVTVELSRVANNLPQFTRPEIEYQIRVQTSAGVLTMGPESAIQFGRHLIEAGAFSVRDLARHCWFLGGRDEPGPKTPASRPD